MDFPDPLSPTSATVLALFIIRESMLTAFSELLSPKAIERFFIWSKGCIDLLFYSRKIIIFEIVVQIRKLKFQMSYRHTIIDQLLQRINADSQMSFYKLS